MKYWDIKFKIVLRQFYINIIRCFKTIYILYLYYKTILIYILFNNIRCKVK